MRNAFASVLAAAAILVPAAAIAQSPTTTRIETRPFYGATVTLEEGVRVFRPLPPHQRVIINPGGKTPLSLGYEEKRSVSHNYHYGDAGSTVPVYSGGVSGIGGIPYHHGRKAHRGGHRHGVGVFHGGRRGHGGGHGGRR